MTKKNGFIELFRFVFAMVLLIHHTGNYGLCEHFTNCPSGFIVVEFFYILIGLFAMAHIEKNIDKIEKPMAYGMKYTVNKLVRLFPYATVGTLVCFIWNIVQNPDNYKSARAVFNGLYNFCYELFFVTFSGAFDAQPSNYKNAPLWFLSGMLIALPLIMYLAVKCRDFFKNYFVWFAPFLIYGWLLNRFGSFAVWSDYTGILYGGVVRAFADILIGCMAYCVSEKIAKLTKGKRILTVAEIVGMALGVYATVTWPDYYFLIFIVILIALSMASSMSGASYTSKLNCKTVNYLGSLAMPIYCIHWGIMLIIGDVLENKSVEIRLITYIITTLVAAVVLKAVVEAVGKKIKKLC